MPNSLILCYFMGREKGVRCVGMMALVLELYGLVCILSTLAFLAWAWKAKLRPDLEEREFDLEELEKLKKLAECRQSDIDPAIDDFAREVRPRPQPPRIVKQRRSLLQGPHLIPTRKHRPT
jgi:hypothetical protein